MLRFAFIRYTAASVFALGIDFTIFMLALSNAVSPVWAACVGYCAGVATHWFLCSRAVFATHLAPSGLLRMQQQLLFAGSAVVGLIITLTVVGIGAMVGAEPRISKILAVGISFQVIYLLRRKFVFA